MKNIWIINHYITNVKNNEKAACRHRYFANELEKRGYNVTLIYSSQEHNSDYNSIEDNSPYKIRKEEKENNVAIKTRPYKGNGKSRVLNMLDFYFGCLKQYKKIVKETTKPDIIIASSVHPLACVAGIKIAKKLNIKCICEIRDLWPLSIVEYKNMSGNNPIIRALYVLEKWIYKKATALVFTMEGGKQYIIDKGWDKKIDLNKVFNINNGIDLIGYKQNEINKEYADTVLNEQETYKLIYAGSLGESDAPEKWIDIFVKLQNRTTKKLQLIYLGNGSNKKLINEICRNNKIENIVCKDAVDRSYIPNILSKCDLLILSAKKTNIMKYGCSFNKLFDYLAAAKPIISNVGSDFVEKNGVGIDITNNSNEESVNKILALINNNDLYKQIQSNERKVVLAYDFKVLVDKLEYIMQISGDKK